MTRRNGPNWLGWISVMAAAAVGAFFAAGVFGGV
jgi:hypothetical protein